MNKKYFEYPYVLLTRGGITPGEDPDPVHGSAHSTVDPCSFEFWQTHYQVDLDGDGDFDFDDYSKWWLAQAVLNPSDFNTESWSGYNPDLPYPTNP